MNKIRIKIIKNRIKKMYQQAEDIDEINPETEDNIMVDQEIMLKSKEEAKSKKSLIGKDKKVYYDSATTNIELDKEREGNQRIQEDMYDQVKQIQAKHGEEFKKNPTNLIGKAKKKKEPFDSAEWAMQMERDKVLKEHDAQKKAPDGNLSDVEEEN